MTTVLQYVIVAAVIGAVVFAIAVFVFGRGEQLAPLSPRTSPTELPDGTVTGGDVESLRFAMAVRGYRMSDVDWALSRLGAEIDRLRGQISELTGEPLPGVADDPVGVGAPTRASTAAAERTGPDPRPTDGDATGSGNAQ